jgi:uncharacterized protein with GYD domain
MASGSGEYNFPRPPNEPPSTLPTNAYPEKGGEMSTYILLSSLTDEGRKTVQKKPERIREVNREIEGMGAKVLGQYAVLGPYDFVSVVEAAGNETMAKISVALGSRGTIQIMTLPAMTIDQFIKTLK